MIPAAKTSDRFAIIHEVASRPDNLLNIKYLCELAGVSRSGYYNWVASEDSRQRRDENDQQDFALILEAYRFRGYDKGARGIYMRLLHMKPPIVMNIKKIRRLMKKYSLMCPIRRANPYRRMAQSIKTSYVAPNLLNREFRMHGPRKVLLTDITYILYSYGKRSYLSTIIDAYTKQVLAYVFSRSLELDFVLETVQMLIQDHGISLQAETLVNSDQGSHYTSYKFIRLLKDKNLRQSMSRRANCWDNAPQESFYGHMKDEIDISLCESHEQVAVIIDDWMDYYNNDRYQWELARLSPNEYYDYTNTGNYPLERDPLPKDFDSG